MPTFPRTPGSPATSPVGILKSNRSGRTLGGGKGAVAGGKGLVGTQMKTSIGKGRSMGKR
jgi:hypothetical protein